MQTLKLKSHLHNKFLLHFSLPSIIITITGNEPWNTETQKGSKSTNHKSQTITFWTHWCKVLFPKRSVKMIDGSEKRNDQLAFEPQNLHVCEKCSKHVTCSTEKFIFQFCCCRICHCQNWWYSQLGTQGKSIHVQYIMYVQ